MCCEPSRRVEEAYDRIVVIIPAYNAARSLGDVIRRTRRVSPRLDIVVVDDGSTDETSLVANQAGVTVIRHTRNMGKGEALRTGFKYALKSGCTAVVTLDADGQHCPEEIPELVEQWLKTGADIIIGTRKRQPGKMPIVRIITNTLSSWMVSLSAGTRIDDSQSGFRLLTGKVLESVRTTSRGYGAESEILIRATHSGFRIQSVPIATIYRSEKSYIHPLRQPLLFIGLMLRSIFWRFEHLVRK